MHEGHDHHRHDEVSGKTLALMTYMLDHNKQHTEELHDMSHDLSHEGQEEASKLLHEAVSAFERGNEKLEQALKLVKGEH
jgi:hypothetical protein